VLLIFGDLFRRDFRVLVASVAAGERNPVGVLGDGDPPVDCPEVAQFLAGVLHGHIPPAAPELEPVHDAGHVAGLADEVSAAPRPRPAGRSERRVAPLGADRGAAVALTVGLVAAVHLADDRGACVLVGGEEDCEVIVGHVPKALGKCCAHVSSMASPRR